MATQAPTTTASFFIVVPSPFAYHATLPASGNCYKFAPAEPMTPTETLPLTRKFTEAFEYARAHHMTQERKGTRVFRTSRT